MTQSIMQIADWLAAHGPIYLLGSTIVLGIGAALMLLCREPLYRQRLGELTITATLVWCMLASIPLDRWSWVDEQREPPVSIPAAPVLLAENILAENAVPVLPVNDDVKALIVQLPVETERSFTPPLSLPTVKASVNWPLAIAAVYLVAAGICAVWLLTGRLVLTLLIRTANAPPDWLATVYEELAGADCRARLLVSRRFRRPICFGVRRPVILLPQHLCQPSQEQQLRHVLLHELAHVRQRDAVGNLALNGALPLLCLHPLYWWISARLRMSREVVADSWAASHCDKNEYIEDLIALSRKLGPAPIGAMGTLGIFRSRFFRRMKMLVERQTPVATNVSKRWSTVALLGFSLGALLLASVCGLDFATAEDEKPPVAEAKKQVEKPMSFDKQTTEPEKAPPYRIGPSDILLIDGVRMAPKAPYLIHTMDVLQIQADGLPEDQPLIGTYQIMPGGVLDLGPHYGTVKIGKKSLIEARKVIEKHLQKVGLAQPTVSVVLIQVSGIQAIQGEHLVTPDGTVTLGMYGSVYIAGMSIDEARAAIEKHLSKYLDIPIISISPFAYNSEKFCYVVTHIPNRGSKVSKVRLSAGTTILDVFSQIEYSVDKEEIQLVRPGKGKIFEPLHSVKWSELVYGDTAQNHHVQAGDIIHMHGRSVDTKSPASRN